MDRTLQFLGILFFLRFAFSKQGKQLITVVLFCEINNCQKKAFQFVFLVPSKMLFFFVEKEKSLQYVFLVLDTIDTNYRTITGYLGGGTAIPGANFILNFSTTDMIVFFIFLQVVEHFILHKIVVILVPMDIFASLMLLLKLFLNT